MARQVRIQFEGAIYHVMGRGNNGNGIFFGKKGYERFLDTLDEACQRTGWIVHAYVLMGNHYHLLIETPEGNLVDGMKWLQGTYTQRVNAWRGRRGHLFQGRYRAQLVNGEDSDGTYFKMVSDYIHLNPARAKMTGAGKRWEKLTDYPWSSLPLYSKWKAKRPLWLEVGDVFDSHRLKDNTRGREAYSDYMNKRGMEVQAGEDNGSYAALRRGWCIGDPTFRQKMLDKAEAAITGRKRESLAGEAIREHNEKEALKIIDESLEKLGIAKYALEGMVKRAVEKRAIAAYVGMLTVVKAEWIAKQLHMGHPSLVSQSKKWAKEDKEGQKWLSKLL